MSLSSLLIISRAANATRGSGRLGFSRNRLGSTDWIRHSCLRRLNDPFHRYGHHVVLVHGHEDGSESLSAKFVDLALEPAKAVVDDHTAFSCFHVAFSVCCSICFVASHLRIRRICQLDIHLSVRQLDQNLAPWPEPFGASLYLQYLPCPLQCAE
jgi:hypothetical protein